MKHTITSRNDLSFTARDDAGATLDWHPGRHNMLVSHDACVKRGLEFFEDLEKLADVDEFDAYTAIRLALCSNAWKPDCGEEMGFADAIARAVIIGLRAMREKGILPFDRFFDPTHSQWCSMQERIELAELQLARFKQKPWRTYEEAGFAK